MKALGILQKLGSGSGGDVFRLSEGRAVKFPKGQDSSRLKKLATENLILKKARHHNILQTFGLQKIEGRWGLVMEMLEGLDLSAFCKQSCAYQAPFLAYVVAESVISALTHLHQLDIVHCDVSTKNIMVTAKGIKLCDFDAALGSKDIQAGRYVLRSNPEYLAPEIWNGSAPSSKSDLFSLGVVIYEILEGKNPLRGLPFLETRLELAKLVNLKPWRASHPAWAKLLDRLFGVVNGGEPFLNLLPKEFQLAGFQKIRFLEDLITLNTGVKAPAVRPTLVLYL